MKGSATGSGKEGADELGGVNSHVLAFPQLRQFSEDFPGPSEKLDVDGEQNNHHYGSLEEYMAHHRGRGADKKETSLPGKTSDDLLLETISEQTEAIRLAQEKIKFYLQEMEMFLPRRK